MASLAAVADLTTRIRPVTLAGEQRIPVLDALTTVVPGAGLQRGTSVAVDGQGAVTSLAVSLVAGAAATGSWVAVVGVPTLGLAAVGELGVPLDRLVVVETPPAPQWASVVAALFDAFDVVVVAPPHRSAARNVRRLAARARDRGAVMVRLAPEDLSRTPSVNRWSEPADVSFRVVDVQWSGLGAGHGVLLSRRVEVEVAGRRLGAPTRHHLWLPRHDGAVALADEAPVVRLPGVVREQAS